MWDGRPALYDAIEFDEAVATIDTLYDLAFLLMDLDRYNQRPAANIVLNRYLWQSGTPLDLQGLVAMPLFLALRAAIRAMVTADRAAQEDGEARGSGLEKAQALSSGRPWIPGGAIYAIARRRRSVGNREVHAGGQPCALARAGAGRRPPEDRSGT